MMAYISRLNLLRDIIINNPNAVIITERCLFTDKYVFAKMLFDSGNMTKIEYAIYNKWFTSFLDNITIDGIIYIKTTPNTCIERINKRNRDGEDIPLDYLKKCHNYHEDWLNNTSIPISYYDGNISVNDDNIFHCMKIIDTKIHDLLADDIAKQYKD